MIAVGSLAAGGATAEPVVVELGRTGDRWTLTRGGREFFIKGAGGNGDMAALSAAGANSVRTWGAEEIGPALERADRHGMTVVAGIWLGQVRQGFDWSDAGSLATQRETVRKAVLAHKDHPALLIWALGNEMEDPEGRNGAVWSEIDSLAAMVKQLDPDHPVMTVIAELGGEKVARIHQLCPHIDIVGINSYAGGPSVGSRYRKLGGTKPWILTEFGPAGIWEIEKDAIGAYPEKSSTAKAEDYRATYQQAVLANRGSCLGSHTFLWGHKQEVTSTWFSMLLPDGSRLAAADTMGELWSGKAPANRCPEIRELRIDGLATGKPGTELVARLECSDPEEDPLRVEWTFRQDPGTYGTGGDAEVVPPSFPDSLIETDARHAKVKLPAAGGLFRLFATVRDGHGGAATANVALRVEAPIIKPPAKRAKLPLVVQDEADGKVSYVPSGWMGDTGAIRLDPDCREQPASGETCTRCEFRATSGWGGVVWQSPPGDWGDAPGGFDLTGATKLTFRARGESGGETVSFSYGILDDSKPFPDTASGKLENVNLEKEWRTYQIPVGGLDLTRIKTGFVWSTTGNSSPTVFYIDAVRWE